MYLNSHLLRRPVVKNECRGSLNECRGFGILRPPRIEQQASWAKQQCADAWLSCRAFCDVLRGSFFGSKDYGKNTCPFVDWSLGRGWVWEKFGWTKECEQIVRLTEQCCFRLYGQSLSFSAEAFIENVCLPPQIALCSLLASGYQIGDDCKPACKDGDNNYDVTVEGTAYLYLLATSGRVWDLLQKQSTCTKMHKTSPRSLALALAPSFCGSFLWSASPMVVLFLSQTKSRSPLLGATKGTMKFYQGSELYIEWHMQCFSCIQKGARQCLIWSHIFTSAYQLR